jgi:hypothetical protein
MADYTVQLPKELYEMLERRAESQHKTADTLVAEMVSDQLDIIEPAEKVEHDEKIAAFEREVAAFERLRPSLMEQYAGQYVAIYQGQVVASGDKKLDVLIQARLKHGPIVFVGLVSEDWPRKARIPSVWIVRQ